VTFVPPSPEGHLSTLHTQMRVLFAGNDKTNSERRGKVKRVKPTARVTVNWPEGSVTVIHFPPWLARPSPTPAALQRPSARTLTYQPSPSGSTGGHLVECTKKRRRKKIILPFCLSISIMTSSLLLMLFVRRRQSEERTRQRESKDNMATNQMAEQQQQQRSFLANCSYTRPPLCSRPAD